MRKKIAVWMVLNFLLATLIGVSSIGPVEANIHWWSWIGPQYSDPIWGTVTAFKENSTATLLVTVRNNLSPPKQLNVSAVKVLLDWNINYSSTEASVDNPMVIPPSLWATQYYTFTISFTIPATSVASNLFQHYYWIYVEEVNATTGPKKVTTHDVSSGSGFVVYSSSQYDAQTLREEIDEIITQYPSLSSAEAQALKTDAIMERNAGEDSYKGRDFDSAKTHYQTALTLLNQMITVEKAYDKRVQENNLKYNEALTSQLQASANASLANATATLKKAEAALIEANATMKMAEAAWYQADAARLQGYSWNLFAVGFILFGVAAIVYAARKPKPPP